MDRFEDNSQIRCNQLIVRSMEEMIIVNKINSREGNRLLIYRIFTMFKNLEP